MLTLLPTTATIVGAVVLSQVPTVVEITGILLVAAGVYLHKPPQ
jgi:inner membrane transporter RhtA